MLKWLSGKKENRKTAFSAGLSLSEEKPFKVSLVAGSGRLIEGRLGAMKMTGVTASFDLEKCPELNPEDSTKLEFYRFENERTFVVRAVVKEAEKTATTRIYDFIFPEPDIFISELNNKHASNLNQRESLRMGNRSYGDIEVDVDWGEGRATGRIIDISVTGMGLGVTPDIAEEMGKPEEMSLQFLLPGCHRPFDVLGKVLYHKQAPDKENVHCGVLFDQNKPGGFLAEDTAISKFLVEEQKEQLKLRVNLE